MYYIRNIGFIKGVYIDLMITIGKNTYIEDEKFLDYFKTHPKTNITIGSGVKIYGYTRILAGENGQISIGDHSIIAGAIFTFNKKITIGKNVIISYYATILDSDFHSVDSKKRKEETKKYKLDHSTPLSPTIEKEIVIEDDVMIGANAIILKGVTIGKGSKVAAGSVVAKNIPKYSYAEGNPVKIYENRQK